MHLKEIQFQYKLGSEKKWHQQCISQYSNNEELTQLTQNMLLKMIRNILDIITSILFSKNDSNREKKDIVTSEEKKENNYLLQTFENNLLL